MTRHLAPVVAWLGTFALLVVLMALLSSCTVAWTRLPDPQPGVARYDVRVMWGVAAP